MLKNIPDIIPPELLKILAEMGHGDTLVIGDGNFPAASTAKRLVRCDGHGVPELLDAILTLMPLDSYVKAPVTLMEVMPGDNVDPVIWREYKRIVGIYEENAEIGTVERFKFYEEAKKAYAVIATGEKALYANIILQKGVIA